MQANGQVINQDPYHYYTITESAEQELIKATNELHLMYLHATDKVLKDDNLLALFDIPKILWPRLRLSWQRRRHHMITGRMDFCMDERGLKVLRVQRRLRLLSYRSGLDPRTLGGAGL